MKLRSISAFLVSLVVFLLVAGPSLFAEGETSVDPVRARLMAGVARELAAHFNAEGDLQVEALRPWALSAPGTDAATEDKSAWSAKLVDFPSTLTSSLVLRIRVTTPQQTIRDETVPCRAQLWRDAWVVQAPTDRGASFDPSHCDVRRVDALRDRDAVPASFINTSDWSYLRPVPAGRLLIWRDLVRRALVRKGDVIEVAAVDGPLQITLKAIAMQDGGKGETVRVRNLESRREFAALVVSENRAQVRF